MVGPNMFAWGVWEMFATYSTPARLLVVNIHPLGASQPVTFLDGMPPHTRGAAINMDPILSYAEHIEWEDLVAPAALLVRLGLGQDPPAVATRCVQRDAATGAGVVEHAHPTGAVPARGFAATLNPTWFHWARLADVGQL